MSDERARARGQERSGSEPWARRTISRRSLLSGSLKAGAAAALAGPVLAACGSSGGSGGSSGDDVLTIGLPVTPKDLGQTTKYLQAFEKKTGIHVNSFTTNTATNTWVSVFQEVSTRLAGGQPIDSAYIATEGMRLFEEKNVLEPLDSYIASDKAEINNFYADVNPTLLSNFRQLDNLHGHTYFIPIGYNVMSIWYNRKLFSSLGIKEPAPGWTWDDFQTACSKIAGSSANRLGFAIGAPTPGPFTDVYPWVLTNGGGILNADQTQCTADSPECIEAATFVHQLVSKKYTNQPGGTYNAFNSAAAGNLGMFGAGIWPNTDIPLSQSEINKQFAIVPWPQKTKQGTPVGVGGFPMFKSTKNKKALWEFIKYTISEEFQHGPVVNFGGDMPIRQSAARSASFLKGFPPGTEHFSDELSYSTMIVGVPNGSAVENEIGTAWEQILTGATSPEAGMKSMKTNVASLMTQQV
ncbi:MAG TPA: sugar ABC transporter substrate-binding protein [Streptosporangiaceae bacterium]